MILAGLLVTRIFLMATLTSLRSLDTSPTATGLPLDQYELS